MVEVVTVQTIAAVVSALAATGVLGIAYRLFQLVKEHDRVLYGEESVAGWNGIVPVVNDNHRRSRRNRQLIEYHHTITDADDLFRGGGGSSD